jgi:hypothetical protein
LYELDQRFRNREAREEDIAAISNLKKALSEREALIKKTSVSQLWSKKRYSKQINDVSYYSIE